jgi:hypothetical protein
MGGDGVRDDACDFGRSLMLSTESLLYRFRLFPDAQQEVA